MFACFSVAWLVQVAVAVVVIVGVCMIGLLLMRKVGLGEPLTTALQIGKIILAVIIAVFVIYFLADLIICAFPRVR